MSTLLQLRIAIAFLGERNQFGWWDSSFLNSLGFKYLSLTFPKTAASASILAASQAASQIHDDRIGKGGVAHVFRLPEEIEIRLRREALSLDLGCLTELCSEQSARQVLNAVANGAKASVGTGPTQVGVLKDALAPEGLARAAATYRAAFDSGRHIFPYFA